MRERERDRTETERQNDTKRLIEQMPSNLVVVPFSVGNASRSMIQYLHSLIEPAARQSMLAVFWESADEQNTSKQGLNSSFQAGNSCESYLSTRLQNHCTKSAHVRDFTFGSENALGVMPKFGITSADCLDLQMT